MSNDSCSSYNDRSISKLMMKNDSYLQKYMTFFAVVGFFAKDMTTPVCAPILMLACRLTRSSVFSALSTWALRRLKVWKSSSSAPASRPVPRKTVLATTSAEVCARYQEARSFRRPNTYHFSLTCSLWQGVSFLRKACNNPHWDKHLLIDSEDMMTPSGLFRSKRNRMRTGGGWMDQ